MNHVFDPAFQQRLLKDIRQCMHIAATMQARLGESDFVAHKQDNSPVTLADLAVQAHIEEFLASETPDWPFIGEENAAEFMAAGHLPPATFWLCDPIDGTQDYASNGSEYAINLALIDHGVPVFGLIAGPGRGHIAYTRGINEVVFEDEQERSRVLAPPRKVNRDEARLVVGHGRKKDVEAYEQIIGHKAVSVLMCASALKFHALLLGEAQVYLRVRETSEWDIAAGEAMVRALGGVSGTLDPRAPFIYGQRCDDFKMPNVYVAFTHEDIV